MTGKELPDVIYVSKFELRKGHPESRVIRITESATDIIGISAANNQVKMDDTYRELFSMENGTVLFEEGVIYKGDEGVSRIIQGVPISQRQYVRLKK